MNTSLFRVMLVSISLCWLLSAKVHLDDQVDPSIAGKIAIESQQEQGVETKVAVEKTIISINGNSGLSAEVIAAKEALAIEMKANKIKKDNAKETANSLEYNLQPVNGSGEIVNNPKASSKKMPFNNNPVVDEPKKVSNEPVNPMQEKIDYYNELHQLNEAAHGGSSIENWSDSQYTNGLTSEKAHAFGTNVYVPDGRDADHTFTACSDSWASEGSWAVYSYADGGYITEQMTFSDNNTCDDVVLNLAPGTYDVDSWDSYGDGGQDIYVDAVFVGSSSGSYSYITVELADPAPTCSDITLVVGGGSWDSEISWDLSDGSSGAAGTFVLCLDDGEYVFNGYDAYSDGWNGGSATFSDADGAVIASFAVEGASGSWTVTIGGAPPVAGCTDADAPNYNADAEVDDGSCEEYCGSTECGYYLDMGYSCYDLLGYGYDCSVCEASGTDCSFPGCSDSQWLCASGDQCIPASYVCDGSSEWGNAGWGPDCADGSDELFDDCCASGDYADDLCNPPANCEDETACNTGAEGDCEYAATGYNCDGTLADGYHADCSGAAVSDGYLGWIGDGYCDDGAYGIYYDCCDYNYDDGDCGNEIGCDGVAVECGGAVNDDCGECGGDNSTCADCAGVANGDAFTDCADTCVGGSYLSWIGDGYCDDGAFGVDFVSCGDFNCDDGDCGTELIDGSCQSSGCSDSEFTCSNGDCIPAGYYCDGSSEWGNAGWGPDCSDGSDELFDECCDAGAYADDLCNPPPTCSDYTWTCGGGSWGSEVSWTIDAGADALVASGSVGEGTFCAEDGDVTFSACDAYGDGWNGNSFVLSDADGNVVFSSDGPSSDLAGGECSAEALTLGGAPPVGGCTDSGAPNYNADAEVDDGSCESYCFDGSGCGAYINYGYDCETLESYGYDCDACEAEGYCPIVEPPTACEEAGGNEGWLGDGYCDGNNNNEGCGYDAGDCCPGDCVDGATYDCATYGGDCNDCADPSSADLAEGGQCADTPPDTTCDDCEFDWTPYGAECCDAAAGDFGLSCGALEGSYGWDCSGCGCPLDDCTSDDDCADGQTCDSYVCTDPPEDCTGLTVNMVDAYGDGWNGNVLTIGTEGFTIDSGDSATGCYNGPSDVVVTCDGGSWGSEVSWDISDADGNVLLAGGAPYSGCLGDCSSAVFGCTDDTACNYDVDATDDDGTCYGPDCAGDCDGGAVVDDCGECNGDGSACAGCTYPNYYADGWCDGANNVAECGYDGGDCCPGDCVDETYSCETYGGDCTDCADPDSADNQEGGECFDTVVGCTDPYADNYNPDANTDDGSCIYDGCAAGTIPGCSDQDIADGDCATDLWVGDGYCDGYAEAYGVNFCCYDLDGGDCTEAECEPPADWDASITNLTAEGVNYDYYGTAAPAVQWDWDDLSDGDVPPETCEDQGLVTCSDGSCAATAEDCPATTCADGNPPLLDCIGTEFCDEDCANSSYDGCVTGETNWTNDSYCDDGAYGLWFDCPEYGCDDCACGVSEGCEDCTDPGEGTDSAACAASFTVYGYDVTPDTELGDCYTDGTGYFLAVWEGECLATSLTYQSVGAEDASTLDLSTYGFTGSFYFFGFGNEETVDFLITFNNDDVNGLGATSATTACPTCESQDLATCEDGSCAETLDACLSCADQGLWDCGDGQCVPESYICDGSSEFCNAGWPADCANGADEGLELCGYEDECDEGDTTCDECEFDWTAYGAECCDAAWDAFGINCAGLEGNYGWDCAGCACPGDQDTGGGDDCVDTDDGATDSYGDGCAAYYDYPSWCGGYDDDDFDSMTMCCACQDRSNDSTMDNVLSTDNNVNAKVYHDRITKYKRSIADGLISANKTLNTVDASVMINVLTGEVTYSDDYDNDNRDVSYTINVSCDTCLAGGPWSGAWEVAQSDFLVYGFDAGSNVCGNVTGNSTLLGSTEASDDACANAGGEVEECEFFDCSGAEACGYESWVGDGYCDDGAYGMYFDCADFDCDAGDCVVECWDGSEACGAADCPEEPSCLDGDVNGDDQVNVTDIVSIVNFILNGGTDAADLDCGDMNADGAINVTDIVTVVNYILGGGTLGSSTATEAVIEIASDQLSVRGVDGDVDGIQLILSHSSDFSIELVNVNQADMEFAVKRSIDNNTMMVIVAMKELSFIGTTTGEYDIISHVVATTDEDGFTGIELSTSETSITEIVDFKLSPAYPNPFNPTTTLELAIPEAGYVSVKVYNLVGQEVATLVDGVMDANPSHTFQWNAGSLSSGVYLVRAEGAGQVTTQKLMLLK